MSFHKRVFLDWASTTPICEKALETWVKTSREAPGNPSSIHREGKTAARKLQQQREIMGTFFGTSPDRIVFTSGGTESNALVLNSLLSGTGSSLRRNGSVLIPDFEHPAVYGYRNSFTNAGFLVIPHQLGGNGIFQLDPYISSIRPDTRLVSIMAVHNETGQIFPLQDIVQAVRERTKELGTSIHIHTDTVQGGGKLKVSLDSLGVDSASFSGHKVTGPRGVGILYIRNPKAVQVPGGGQERGIRPGTENLPAIASMAEAFRIYGDRREEVTETARFLLQGLAELPKLSVLPRSRMEREELFLPSIISFTAYPIPSEVLVRALDDRGFALSPGSACSAKRSKGKRRALIASGVDPAEAAGAVRVSIGPGILKEEIEAFLTALHEVVEELGRAF